MVIKMTGEKNRFKTTEKLWDLDDKQLKSPQHDAMVLWLMDEDNLKPLLSPLTIEKKHNDFFNNSLGEGDFYRDDMDIDSEKPIMSSPTFIAGYADLVVHWDYVKLGKREPCLISKKWYAKTYGVEYVDELQEIVKEHLKNNDCEFNCYFEDEIEGNEIDIIYLFDEVEVSPWDYDDYGFDSSRDFKEYCIIKKKYRKKHHPVIDFMYNVLGNKDTEYHIPQRSLHTWLKQEEDYREYYISHNNFLIEVKPYIDSFGAVLRQIKSYKRFNGACAGYGDDYYCLFTLDSQFDKQFESQGIHVLHPPADVSIDDMRKMYGL